MIIQSNDSPCEIKRVLKYSEESKKKLSPKIRLDIHYKKLKKEKINKAIYTIPCARIGRYRPTF